MANMAKDPVLLQATPTKRSRAASGFEGLVCASLGWLMGGQLGIVDLVPFLRGVPFTILVVAVVGALIGMTRGLPVLRVGAGVVLCLWLMVAYTPLAAVFVTPLKVEQAPEAADAVVVLQAGVQKDNDFSTATLGRTLHALELIHQGFASRLILTEDGPAQGSHERAATTLMKNLGVHCQLFTVGPVHNTHDEAVLASALAKQHGWKKILLVTSPTHSRRAFYTFRKTGLQVVSTPCRETTFDFENMSDNEENGRIRAFAEMLREVVGLRMYRARGWA
ncbi:hypothetical protein IAD21_00417 [Abditibacteriota bacterium]|nr:hypothetical protein IAD21_00417 [Abditibacteriota bacterium]